MEEKREKEEKTRIRKAFKALLRELPEGERHRQEKEVSAALVEDPDWKICSWVFGFLPMPHEFNLESLLAAAIASGKRLALPKLTNGRMQFHEVSDLKGPWVLHSYGMREPGPHSPVVDTHRAALEGLLIIVPGLAFNRQGFRIGYGGGFYDRLLSGLPDSVHTVSCLYRQQLVSSLPVEPHDSQVSKLFFSGSGGT